MHQQVQPGIRAYRAVCAAAVGLGDAVQFAPDLLGRGLRQVQEPGRPVARIGGDVLRIPRHIGCRAIGRRDLLPVVRNLVLGADALFLENALLLFEAHNLVVELRLFQQVGIAGEDSDKFGEVHPVVLVHAVLVDAAHGDRAAVDLVDEHLLVLQQIELVGVERLFRAVDDHVHGVAAPQLHGVALAYRAAVALLHIRRTPGNVEVMHRHGPFLCVYARAQHARRAEQHAHPACVHILEEPLAGPFGLGALDEADFRLKDR